MNLVIQLTIVSINNLSIIEISEFKLEISNQRKADLQKISEKNQDVIQQVNEVYDSLRNHICKEQKNKVCFTLNQNFFRVKCVRDYQHQKNNSK